MSSRQLVAIMFTDIVGYTTLMGNDEQKAFEILSQNRQLQKPIIEKFCGRWIKELGDGVMASFSTVSDAVFAAKEIQVQCRATCGFTLRIGIHQGEIVFEDEDIFGDAVNVASRIQAIAAPGTIWVSEVVHLNVANKNEIETCFIKTTKLKNVKEAVKIYSIRLDGEGRPGTSIASRVRQVVRPFYVRPGKLLLVTSGCLIMAVAGYLIYNISVKNKLPVNTVAASEKSIAVLPFADMSIDKAQEYFSDGLSEELLNLLAKVPGLKVTARTSSFAFKGKNEDIRSISEKLGVAYILEGSVRKDKSHLRITTQLINAREGTQLWSNTYEREMDDIFKIQEEIARAVVKELKLTLMPGNSGGSGNPDVHNLILQGNYFFDKLDKDNVAKGMDFYRQAAAVDSSDGRVWAMMAKVYSRQAWQNYIDQKAGYIHARETAMKALSIDPNSTEALLVLGGVKLYYDFAWSEAKDLFDNILLREPHNADALNNLAAVYQATGQWTKAVEVMKQAIAVDPLKPIFYSNQGANYTYLHRIGDANLMYEKALGLNEHFQRAHMYLGRNFLLQGKTNLALKEMEKESVDVFREFGLALAYHAANDKEKSAATMQHFIAVYAKEWPYLLAELFAFRNEKEMALKWLNLAYNRNDSWLFFVKGDPLLKNVWNEPGYLEILKKMKL